MTNYHLFSFTIYQYVIIVYKGYGWCSQTYFKHPNLKLYDKPPRKPTVLIVGVRQNGTISINVAGFKLSLFPISFMIYF